MDQEKIKRIILAVLLAIAGSYITYTALIEPAQSSIKRAEKEAEELQANIRKGRGMQAAVADLEKKVAEGKEKVDAYFRNQQKGAPVAWVPPQIEGFFARQGVKAIVKSAGAPEPLDPKTPDLQVYSWTVDVAGADFIKLGTAIAAFENAFPLAQINTLRIAPAGDSPALQTCSMKVFGIIRQ